MTEQAQQLRRRPGQHGPQEKGRRALEIGRKICVVCMQDKPLWEYHWIGGTPIPRSGDGRRSECKECMARKCKERDRQRREDAVFRDLDIERKRLYRLREKQELRPFEFARLKTRLLVAYQRTGDPDPGRRARADARYVAAIEKAYTQCSPRQWQELQSWLREVV